MVKFRLSAFSDEYSSVFDEQIEGLLKNKIGMTEIRGVDGTNIADLSTSAVEEAAKKLTSAGIAVSAIGSPIGKIKITDPMEPHLDKLKQVCETASVLATDKIRMFSFYIPEGTEPADCKDEVVDRMGKMLDVADEYNLLLCHENEKGIYGDTPERCLELFREFDGRLGLVFDPANYIQCGCDPLKAYFTLAPYTTYMHIKDADARGTIVPAGRGVGSIPEILALINNARSGDFTLTIEPHLAVFKGLDALEGGEKTMLGNAYSSNEEAFCDAVLHTRYCFPRTCEQEF
ncbi:MAG: sugar phosphate isomerase/epimerase [Ruminococcaceae bacterium]|nr:sugar phosphate isomerase/epimerase [Oscillospiraceae bacterium]